MDMDVNFKVLWDISKEYLKKGRTVDLAHTRVCVDFAFRLLREEGGDRDIVIPAIILHDTGYSAIEETGLYKKTTYFGVYKKNQVKGSPGIYSSELKKLHMLEGVKLAKSILMSLKYDDKLIDAIVDIVGDHEDSNSFPPSTKHINKIIVSDADKLFRFTPFNFSDNIVKIHGASTEEAFLYLLAMRDKWLITKTAQMIAEEEIRKIPESDQYSSLFE